MRPRVIICELLTVAWLVYVLVSTHVEQALYPLTRAVDTVLLALCALTVAWAAWKNRPWAPKGAVIVAAVIGLPTLSTTIGRFDLIVNSETLGSAIRFALLPLVLIVQLLALLEGFRHWRSTGAAA